MRVFFWVYGEWIGVRNKQIEVYAFVVVQRYDSFPMNLEKTTLIPYIYDASNKEPLLNSQRNVIK